MQVREEIGRVVGVLLAPFAAAGSFLRGARLFHPEGVVHRAEVRASATEGALGALAERLSGPAFARLSSGMRTGEGAVHGRDVLGIALRFHTAPVAVPEPGAPVQDLILVSFRRLWQLPIAAQLTNPNDFLQNIYYAIAPFRVAGLGLVEFRLVPARPSPAGENRFERLDRAIAEGTAALELQIRKVARGAAWQPLTTITLRERVPFDQTALRFDPFHAGLGIEPAGFVQAVRRATYPASQLGRSLRRRIASRR